LISFPLDLVQNNVHTKKRNQSKRKLEEKAEKEFWKKRLMLGKSVGAVFALVALYFSKFGVCVGAFPNSLASALRATWLLSKSTVLPPEIG
jgi:hypothetical protein